MNKKLKIIASALALCVTFNVSFPVMATPEEASLDESKVKYQQLNDEIKQITEKISSLDSEIEEINLDLENNSRKIEDIKIQIENTKNLLAQNEEEMIEAQKRLDIRVRSIYKTNLSSNMIIFILESKNLSDLFTRINSISRIVSVDKQLMEDIDEKKLKIQSTIEELNSSEEELNSLNTQIQSDLQQVEVKKIEQQSVLEDLNDQKDNIFAIIEANEKLLIEHPLSVINSSGSSVSAVQDAVNNLEGLLPQLSIDSIISLAQDGIYQGNAIIEAANTTPESPSPSIDTEGKATYQMESTAYTGGTYTAMGLKPVYNPDGISTIAVDPSVIPLGSKVFVSGYGVAIASDTGGAIKGNIIDVYFNSYSECISWGRRQVEVTVLAYPGEW